MALPPGHVHCLARAALSQPQEQGAGLSEEVLHEAARAAEDATYNGNPIGEACAYEAISDSLPVLIPAIRQQQGAGLTVEAVRERLLSDAGCEAVARVQHGGPDLGDGQHAFDYVDGEDLDFALHEARRTTLALLAATFPDTREGS